MLLTWLSGIGLSMPLILATLFVKMLRVYHIFTTFKVLKQNSKYKDYALLVYTTLIVLPQVTLLIMWTAIDPIHNVKYFTEHPGFIEIEEICGNKTTLIWYAFSIAYFCILFTAIVFVAIKSRKIRSIHFKDTKKINLLITLLFIIGVCGMAYSYTFSYAGYFSYSAIVLYVAHILTAFLCQITLFVPKIWPALQNHYADAKNVHAVH